LCFKNLENRQLLNRVNRPMSSNFFLTHNSQLHFSNTTNQLFMQKQFLIGLVLIFQTGNLFAQQLLTAPYQWSPEQETSLHDLPGITLQKPELCNRQAIIDDYNNVYLASSVTSAQLAWTGSVATCTPGTTSDLAKTYTLNRINYFRKLVGVPNNMVLDQNAYEANCQAAALIMDANDNLSHSPPNNWTCWTQAGSNGAGSSNLALGAHASGAISLYMIDPGTGNEPAGHRRWILNSRASKFGTGSSSSTAANALFVFGPSVVPPSLPSFIAYPSEGFFPRSLMPTRWSFGIPGGNFSTALVVVKDEVGATVGITQHPYQVGYGDNTLTWEMPGSAASFANKEDVVYTVTVSGITNALATTYTYKVVLIYEETPTVLFTKTDPTCENNGSVSASFSAGAKSYAWSNGLSTAGISNVLPGTYTVTITDKSDCTTVATVELLDNSVVVIAPGDASTATVVNCAGNIQLNLSTTGATNLGTNQIVGWWFTQDAPASNAIADQATLNTALAGAAVNPAIVTPGLSSFMFKSGSGTTLSKAFTCGAQLDPNKTYYATPFVTQNDSPAPISYTNNTTAGNIPINDVNAGIAGKTEIPVKVWQVPTSANLKKVCVQITYGGFCTLNDLDIKIRDPFGTEIYLTSFFPGFANGTAGFNACYVDDMSGVNVWDGCNGNCYTGLINSETNFNPFKSIDPNGTWTLIVTDDFNQGFKPNFIKASFEFDEASYAINFPEVAFSNCVMGDPVHFSCAETNAPATPIISGQTQFCSAVAGTLSVGAGYQTYLWNNGQTSTSIQIQQAGTYTVTVSNAVGCTASSSTNVQMGTIPSTSISGNTEICQGQPTSLDAGAGFSAYAWSNGQITRNISVQNAGTYTVTITNASTCTNTATVAVNIINVPSPSISGDLSFCPGVNTTLSAPAGFSAYQWSTNQNTPSIQVQQAGSYQVTVTNNQGCTATNVVMVSVLPAPTVNISGIQSFCEGASATLISTAGFSAYTWSTGQTTQNITVMQGGMYTVTVVNAQGCTGTANRNITVNPHPTTSISGNLAFCAGQTTLLSASQGLSGYTWNTGQTTQNITVSQGGTYSVTVVNAQGCTGTASQNIAVNPLPTASINGNLSFCLGKSTVLTANQGLSTYAWNTGETTNAITVTTAGTYSTTVTNSFGCTDDASANVSTVANPTVDLGPDKVIVQGQQIVLNASGPGLTYFWSTGATTGTLTVQLMGTYSVTVTNAAGCTATDDIKVEVTSDASEPESAFKIEVFPNPAVESLQFRSNGFDVTGLILENIQGKVLLNKSDFISKDTWQKLDIRQLPVGTYFLILRGTQYTSTVKFVKAGL
jgi:hypothetical protein